MKRKEIKNLNDFINIGSRYIIYSDFDCEVINKIDLCESIMNYIIHYGLKCRWYNYFTLGVYDKDHRLLCYINFNDDYVCIDLNTDLLAYTYDYLKFIYILFDDYYYFWR